ncbi:UNVERIFIED_CONTAM: hypothetical protein FKN15_050660 [Acipenser sinensis]
MNKNLLRISKFNGQAVGRNLAALGAARHQLWLSQVHIADGDKAPLLDAPITRGHTFDMVQRPHRAKELVHLLPKRPPPVHRPAPNWRPRFQQPQSPARPAPAKARGGFHNRTTAAHRGNFNTWLLNTVQTGYSLQFKHGPPPFRDVTTTLVTDLRDALVLFQEKSQLCTKDIAVGQTVITKHKNLRYYSCRVTEITSQTFYELTFDDGSFSNDTYPEDIVTRDCLQLGPPAVGEAVQVKWPDGLFYGAKYLGSNTSYMYQVEFEDGSQLLAKREDVYTLDEELPKKVKGRLSTASSMRFEDTFYGQDLIQGERKRQRVPNSRFKNDYVADPGYRTFKHQGRKGQ